MKIILLKDVPKIGRKNDVKDVADGYALNFIIPRGLGMKATPADLKRLETTQSVKDTEKRLQEDLLKKSLDDLSAITITIKEKANDKGHLFEGIHKERLAKEIEKISHITIDPNYIELNKPLKE